MIFKMIIMKASFDLGKKATIKGSYFKVFGLVDVD
jgi:hypothetical protein